MNEYANQMPSQPMCRVAFVYVCVRVRVCSLGLGCATRSNDFHWSPMAASAAPTAPPTDPADCWHLQRFGRAIFIARAHWTGAPTSGRLKVHQPTQKMEAPRNNGRLHLQRLRKRPTIHESTQMEGPRAAESSRTTAVAAINKQIQFGGQ